MYGSLTRSLPKASVDPVPNVVVLVPVIVALTLPVTVHGFVPWYTVEVVGKLVMEMLF